MFCFEDIQVFVFRSCSAVYWLFSKVLNLAVIKGTMKCLHSKWFNFSALIILVLMTVQNDGTKVTISGQINTDTVFYYRQLSDVSSKVATVTYSIKFKKVDTEIILDIYTTEDDQNLKTNCSNDGFGQLRNENLLTPMTPRLPTYRFTTCTLDHVDSDILHCEGETTIQDYKPRRYAFSIGYDCMDLVRHSLEGLSYNFTISQQTNRTECSKIENHMNNDFFLCHELYTHTSLPNMMGDPDFEHLHRWMRTGVVSLIVTLALSSNEILCYKHARELSCHVFYPKCDSNKQVIHPCKETCHEFVEACFKNVESAFKKMRFIGSRFGMSPDIDVKEELNCDYLPSLKGPINCYYRPVTCRAPPNINNTRITKGLADDGIYLAMSQVEYKCLNETFQMEGNKTLTCLYNGLWSKTPKCLKDKNMNPLSIVIPLLTIPFLIFITCTIMKYICQRKKILPLERNKEYDAFVCYNFDEDFDFVFNSILPELEENHDPPLKMFIHDRDFALGEEISTNICNAIENSNSAIIVISQGFVDSPRCREEFTKCLAESEEDPAFKLFIILMEEVDTLVNTPRNLQKFFRDNTYIKREDTQLFEKIGNHLDMIRQHDVIAQEHELLFQNQVEL